MGVLLRGTMWREVVVSLLGPWLVARPPGRQQQGDGGTRNLDLTTSSPCTSSLLPSSTPSSDITSPPILLSSLLQLLIVPLFPFTTPRSQITSTFRMFTSFTLHHLLLHHHHRPHLQQQPQQPPHHQQQHFQFHQEQKVAKTTKEPQLDVFLASTNKA